MSLVRAPPARLRIGLALLFPLLASAGKPREHRGLMFGLTMGPGFAHASSPQTDGRIAGWGLALSAAVGTSLADAWTIYGVGVLYHLPNPEVRLRPTIGPFFSSDPPESAGVVGIGVGLKRHFLASNAYLAVEALAAGLTAEVDGESSFDTDPGPGLRVVLGKEWWITDHVGLGAAAEALFAFRMRVDTAGFGEREDWNAFAGAAVLSATYRRGTPTPEEILARSVVRPVAPPPPPVVYSYPSFGYGARMGPGVLTLPNREEQTSPAFGIAIRPGVHFTPHWSTWLDLRLAGANTAGLFGVEGDSLGAFESSACLRGTLAPFSLETGLGVAHIWRNLNQNGDDVRVSRTGIVVPIRMVAGWNLDNPGVGITVGVEVSFQRYEEGTATWFLVPVGVEW